MTDKEQSFRSVSQLTAYLECGECYRLRYIERVPRKPAAWFPQGIAFHEGIEFWERFNREPDLQEVLEQYYAAWDDGLASTLEFGPDDWLTGTAKRDGPADIELRMAKGADQVADYMEFAKAHEDEWHILKIDGEPMLEQRFELIVPHTDEKEIVVVGYIDQMVEYANGAIRVRDLKTGTKRPVWEIQLGIYALAMREKFGIDDCWTGDYYMAKDKSTTRDYDLHRFPRWFVEQQFQMLERGIENKVFLSNPGTTARVCPVSDWCYAEGGNNYLLDGRNVREF